MAVTNAQLSGKKFTVRCGRHDGCGRPVRPLLPRTADRKRSMRQRLPVIISLQSMTAQEMRRGSSAIPWEAADFSRFRLPWTPAASGA